MIIEIAETAVIGIINEIVMMIDVQEVETEETNQADGPKMMKGIATGENRIQAMRMIEALGILK